MKYIFKTFLPFALLVFPDLHLYPQELPATQYAEYVRTPRIAVLYPAAVLSDYACLVFPGEMPQGIEIVYDLLA